MRTPATASFSTSRRLLATLPALLHRHPGTPHRCRPMLCRMVLHHLVLDSTVSTSSPLAMEDSPCPPDHCMVTSSLSILASLRGAILVSIPDLVSHILKADTRSPITLVATMEVDPRDTHQLPCLRAFLARVSTNNPLSHSLCTMTEDTSRAATCPLANLFWALAHLPAMLSASPTAEVLSFTPHHPRRGSRNSMDGRVSQHKVERLPTLRNLLERLELLSQRLKDTLSSPLTLWPFSSSSNSSNSRHGSANKPGKHGSASRPGRHGNDSRHSKRCSRCGIDRSSKPFNRSHSP